MAWGRAASRGAGLCGDGVNTRISASRSFPPLPRPPLLGFLTKFVFLGNIQILFALTVDTYFNADPMLWAT